jgi:streptomycin 6-kinase
VPGAPVIDLEAVRARLARRFGPEVAGWCAGLPALADALAARWELRLGPAESKGGTSVVLRCESADGEPLVLKLTPDPRSPPTRRRHWSHGGPAGT